MFLEFFSYSQGGAANFSYVPVLPPRMIVAMFSFTFIKVNSDNLEKNGFLLSGLSL